MQIIQNFVINNDCYKRNNKINVKGLMLHSVGCAQPNAQVFVKGYNKPNFKVCVHAFIDANTGTIYQTLPWNHLAWHCGGSANNTHIGIEMCEPDCITYTKGATFTCNNVESAIKKVTTAYNSAVELFAQLCKDFNLNPLADGVIISHNEGYKRGVASGHVDPEHLWSQLKLGYTMNGFRKDVANKMNSKKEQEEKKEQEDIPSKKEIGEIIDDYIKNYILNNPDIIYKIIDKYIADLEKKPATFEKEALDWATNNGILVGNQKGELMPKRFITRGENIIVLKRFAEKFLK